MPRMSRVLTPPMARPSYRPPRGRVPAQSGAGRLSHGIDVCCGAALRCASPRMTSLAPAAAKASVCPSAAFSPSLPCRFPEMSPAHLACPPHRRHSWFVVVIYRHSLPPPPATPRLFLTLRSHPLPASSGLIFPSLARSILYPPRVHPLRRRRRRPPPPTVLPFPTSHHTPSFLFVYCFSFHLFLMHRPGPRVPSILFYASARSVPLAPAPLPSRTTPSTSRAPFTSLRRFSFSPPRAWFSTSFPSQHPYPFEEAPPSLLLPLHHPRPRCCPYHTIHQPSSFYVARAERGVHILPDPSSRSARSAPVSRRRALYIHTYIQSTDTCIHTCIHTRHTARACARACV